MKKSPIVIENNHTLRSCLHSLTSQDLINCRILLKPNEEHLLLDLVSRRVNIFPSATAQLASKSKVFQTRLFYQEMLPDTLAIYNIHDLMNAISHYKSKSIRQVIFKHDRKNGGLGVHLYQSVEEIFNNTAHANIDFPFVLQPYIPDCEDIRVIFLGTYLEAYQRTNPNNFRQNLHCGGKSTEISLTTDQLDVCERVMTRGGFPYAHIDLFVLPSGKTYLTEINLRGGIRGATISAESYKKELNLVHLKQKQAFLSSRPAD